jgi:chorismate synthase
MTGLCHLIGDVRPGVTDAHHQDRPIRQLGRVAVVAGVQLPRRRVQMRRELRNVLSLERPGRHDHVARPVARGSARDLEAIAAASGRPQAGHPLAGAHRQPVLSGVGLQIVGHLSPGRKHEPRQRE